MLYARTVSFRAVKTGDLCANCEFYGGQGRSPLSNCEFYGGQYISPAQSVIRPKRKKTRRKYRMIPLFEQDHGCRRVKTGVSCAQIMSFGAVCAAVRRRTVSFGAVTIQAARPERAGDMPKYRLCAG